MNLNTDHIRDLELLFEYSEKTGILESNPDLKKKVLELKSIYCIGSNCLNFNSKTDELKEVLADLVVHVRSRRYRSKMVELGRTLNGVN